MSGFEFHLNFTSNLCFRTVYTPTTRLVATYNRAPARPCLIKYHGTP